MLGVFVTFFEKKVTPKNFTDGKVFGLHSTLDGYFAIKALKNVGTGVLCQEQDCKQLCKRIVYTFYVKSLRFWKPNGA